MRDTGNVRELRERAANHNIPIEYDIDVIDEGWFGNPKGMAQILWERGFLDPSKRFADYTKKGKKDKFGNVDKSTSLMEKGFYRRLPLKDKKGKTQFLSSVRKSISRQTITTHLERKFSRRARRYILTYHAIDNGHSFSPYSDASVSVKTHRCA